MKDFIKDIFIRKMHCKHGVCEDDLKFIIWLLCYMLICYEKYFFTSLYTNDEGWNGAKK